MALAIIGVDSDDEVVTSTLTFAATANAISYQRAKPIFIDSERQTWNMDPDLLATELRAAARRGKLPKAVIVVDIYGQCADYDAIVEICGRYDVPIVEDAAEALGATYRGRPAGTFGAIGCFSFNGNKIITTSGGGMLTSNRPDYAQKARFLATQARDAAPHYQHSTIGYNYRMSNLLAAVGRGQLDMLDDRVARRRANFEFYRKTLGSLPGIAFMPEHTVGQSTRWLTCMTIEPEEFGTDREEVRLALDRQNIEARPVWKPMHLQPIFSGCRMRGGAVSEELFEHGLCLPSGSSLTEEDQLRVVNTNPFGRRASSFAGSDCRHGDFRSCKEGRVSSVRPASRPMAGLMKRLTCCWHFCCDLEFLSVFSCLCSTAGRDRPNGFRRQGGKRTARGLRNF